MRIIVGAVSTQRPPSAGNQCNWVHWVEGLRRLGHDVTFVEQIAARACFDQAGRESAFRKSTACRQFITTMARYGLSERCCLIYDNGLDAAGLTLHELEQVASDADLLINFSGCVTAGVVMERVRRRAYLDTDPVFTQLWHAVYGVDLGLARHNVWLTIGLNIGTPFSPIPDCGLAWVHAGRPMVPDLWPQDAPGGTRFTTVAAWRVFGDLCYQGEWYRSKAHELERFVTLPSRTAQEIEIALREDWGERQAFDMLRTNGWHVVDASTISTLDRYARYVSGSRAELGIAKHAYVKARSGWFSDRSAHYLACGRPVVHQSTGFERMLPVGDGLLTFADMDSLVSAIETLNSDYPRHSRAARDFAAEFLDYRRVIPAILDRCSTDV